jgi:hypothetical protein
VLLLARQRALYHRGAVSSAGSAAFWRQSINYLIISLRNETAALKNKTKERTTPDRKWRAKRVWRPTHAGREDQRAIVRVDRWAGRGGRRSVGRDCGPAPRRQLGRDGLAMGGCEE